MNGDLAEYNQCQTMLYGLYNEGLNGERDEFIAYRILYLVFTNENLELTKLLINLTLEMREMKAVKHSLRVVSSYSNFNFYQIFVKLYPTVPNLGKYIFDLFSEKMRIKALNYFIKSFRIKLPISYIITNLGFENQSDFKTFISNNFQNKIVYADEDNIDCKETFNLKK
jgi:SAC3 family protein LENG8/THP3